MLGALQDLNFSFKRRTYITINDYLVVKHNWIKINPGFILIILGWLQNHPFFYALFQDVFDMLDKTSLFQFSE